MVTKVMHLNHLQWQTEGQTVNQGQSIFGAHPPAGVYRQKLLWSFNRMVLTGIIPGQALGADLAELSINKALRLTWDGGNE